MLNIAKIKIWTIYRKLKYVQIESESSIFNIIKRNLKYYKKLSHNENYHNQFKIEGPI